MNYPTYAQVVIIRERIKNQSLCACVMSDRDLQHNYIIELLGVIQFNIFYSLNWVRNVISSDCEWQTLTVDPNDWV
jgi:hypothetical protein